MENWFYKRKVRLSLYFFMPIFFASFVIGLGLTIIEAMDRLLPLGAALSQRQEIEYLRWYIKAATLGSAAIAVIIGFVIAVALNRPLKRLEEALKKIVAGDIEELNIDATNEFVSLSKSFNTALGTIKQRLLTAKDNASSEAAHGLERLERLAVLGGISAIIAHEIKNPLASIKGLTQLMAEESGVRGQGSGSRGKYTSVMLEEIERLDKVADNLLYLSKPVKQDYKYYDIRLLLDKVAATALQAANKRVEILRDNDKTPIEIWMDSDRLERAFLNLLINAVQASPEKQDSGVREQGANNVVVRLASPSKEPVKITVAQQGDKVSVRISNKGSFIPPEDREKIFEPFYTTKGKKGTGLGLAVAKHIVCSYGGDIKVESNEEETTFIVELPIKEQVIGDRS